MECTDITADVNTTSRLEIGQSNNDAQVNVLETCTEDPFEDFEPDVDWHKVQLQYGRTYLFFLTVDGTAPTQQAEFLFYDRFGNMETVFDDQGNTHYRYTARYSGSHFVSVSQGTHLNGTTYAIDAYELNDDNKSTGPTIGLVDGYAKIDAIEEVGDTDTFDFLVHNGRSYKFIVVGTNGGETLANPSLELYRNGSLIGNGQQVIEFDSGARETLQIQVGGNDGTGTYRVIGLVADEAGQDTQTQSELVFDENGLATLTGYVSEFQDFDWHKVMLNEGDIVHIELKASGLDYLETPNLIFRDPNINVIHGEGINRPSDSARIEYYYEAQSTGFHYVVARTKVDLFNGEYQVSVEKTRTPADPIYNFGRGETGRILVENDASVPLSSLLDLKGLTPFAYEVYSTVPLIRDGNVMDARNNYGIIADEIGLWTVNSSEVSELGDLLVRAVVNGDWSEWQKFSVVPAFAPASLDSGSEWEGSDPVTYSFVSARPADYGDNEFGEFRAIGSEAIRDRFTEVFEQLTLITGRQFTMTEGGASGDIDIFSTTELGRPFLSFLPETGRGGDVILNEADFAGELDPNKTLRILRALGPALGLTFNDLAFEDSVLGTGEHSKGLVPNTLGKDDWLVLQEKYGTAFRDPSNETTSLANFVLSASPELSTIAFEGRNVLVGDDVQDVDFNIDLRDGRRSLARDENVITSEVTIGYGAQVVNAVGGNGDDFLFGNGLENVLQGGGGNDFLSGYENDDVMVGGAGDDTFIHYFGDGHDLVSDSSGVDTLCFIGTGPFENERLFEDFEFTRSGRFLEVSLTLDAGLEEGSVRIDNGINNNNLVERLELWHDGALRQRISLFSLYNELSDGQTGRFNVLATSDNFGRLVELI